MKKSELKQKTDAVVNDYRYGLQYIFNLVPKGQQQKILKDEKAKRILEQFHVI